MYALCVSGAGNMHNFVWKFFYVLYKKNHSLFKSRGHTVHLPCAMYG